jgi:murein DD-endopeptidase MepM/ murein hydrolase activator NlpD
MLKVDQNSVDPRPATGERFRAANFGEAGEIIARGAETFGRTLGDVTAKLDEKYDTATVKQADAEDLAEIIKIKGEAMSATGFDAQTAVANARQQIADIRKRRVATLHGRQREMYSDVFDQRNLQIEESFGTHLSRQINEAEKNASVARAETYRDAATDSYGTSAFETNLATAEGEVASINKGAGPDVIGRAQAQLRSQVYSRVVDNLLADPEHVQDARIAIEKHAADLLPEDETALRKKLNPLIEEDQTESDAGWAFTNSKAPGSDPLAPKGEYYPTEGPETPPRPSIEGPSSRAQVVSKPISPTDPLRGKGRVSNTAAQHRARGSGNALDIAAPTGTAIYSPMSGKVIKNWWSKEGGWSLLVEHPNGYVTGYAHMRSQSALREGQAVDKDIPIGSVGMTGEKATGPHVHYTVRQSRAGPKVDPNAIDWGQTVKPESVDWKEAPLTRFAPEENALGRALSRIHDRATQEGWSNRRYQRAVDRVRQISGVQEQLYNQQQEERWKGALQTVVDLGDKLTSRSQIPGFGQLDPAHQLSIDGIIKQNLNPSEEGKANGPVFLDLLTKSIDPAQRDSFLNVDLLAETRITRGERTQLVRRQAELRQAPDGPLAGHLDAAWSAANRYLPKGQDGFTDDQRRLFTDRFMQSVTARQNELKRPLTDREKDDIARAQVVDVVRRGPGGENLGAGKLFEYGDRSRRQPGDRIEVDIPKVYSQIAPETRNQIIGDLKRRGHSFTPRDIVSAYLEMSR